MISLAIETAAGTGSVAVSCNNNVQQITFEQSRQQTQRILPAIDSLLADMEVGLAQVELVIVSIGPGSFTGLRVGIAVAQALAWGRDIPVLPISTLRTVAQSAYRNYGFKRMIVGLNAYMNELYWADYRITSSGIAQAVQSECLLTPQALPQMTNDMSTAQLVGGAWHVYQAQLPSDWSTMASEAINLTCQAQDLVCLAQAEDCVNESISAEFLKPVYLRGSSAWQTSS